MSNTDKIFLAAENIKFSNGTTLKSKISNVNNEDGKLRIIIDIGEISIMEAEEKRDFIIDKFKKTTRLDDISIIFINHNKKNKKIPQKTDKITINKVKKVILIASGKGGVGKSTITSLLAHKLKSEGKKVGIIDADIYGPSIPNMFSISQKPELEDNKMVPLEKYGIYINSIALITAPGSAVSWRGPMVTKALYQLINLTLWPELDYLLIDSPPGTGDIHLSLLQSYNIDKVLMVTTPQVISELDVDRSINLYKKFDVPISGIIENMYCYFDSVNNKEINIFSGNAAENIAKKYNIPVISKIPILSKLSYNCDIGMELSEYTSFININVL